MPEMDGITLLKEIKKDYPETMAIMLSGYGCIESAVKAVKLGAVDFLEKPISPEGLRFCLSQLYEKWKAKKENRTPGVKIEPRFGYDELVGSSAEVKKLKQIIAKVGPTNAPVLIQGQTGTGKELVARAVHYQSRRSKKSFMPVDCAAISETVIESELFGHVKGAFTGARRPYVYPGYHPVSGQGHPVSGRDRRTSPIHSGETAENHSGERSQAGGQQQEISRRYPGNRRHESRSGSGSFKGQF
jgi:DNA-binding NtrC family response regulator